MQLGLLISHTGLKENSFITGSRKAKQMGYDCVELGACDAEGTLPVADLGQMSMAEAEQTAAEVRAQGVEISAIQCHLHFFLDQDEAVVRRNVEHINKILAVAARIGVGFVHTVAGVTPPNMTTSQAIDQLAACYDELLDAAGESQVGLGIEPVFSYVVGNLETMQALDAALGRSELLINFDPSHFPYHEEDPVTFLKEYGPRIPHTHAKDAVLEPLAGPLDENSFETPTGKLFRFAPPGTGVLDWPAIIQALREVGYDGVISLELGHGIPNEEQAARDNVKFLRGLLG